MVGGTLIIWEGSQVWQGQSQLVRGGRTRRGEMRLLSEWVCWEAPLQWTSPVMQMPQCGSVWTLIGQRSMETLHMLMCHCRSQFSDRSLKLQTVNRLKTQQNIQTGAAPTGGPVRTSCHIISQISQVIDLLMAGDCWTVPFPCLGRSGLSFYQMTLYWIWSDEDLNQTCFSWKVLFY